MVFEISHKTRPIDFKIFSHRPVTDSFIVFIKEEAVNFIEKRFGYKFKGSYINGSRTVSIVEAPNRKSLEKMVKIGVPIFTVMTKARFEDLHIKESSIVCKENLNTLIENSLEILEA